MQSTNKLRQFDAYYEDVIRMLSGASMRPDVPLAPRSDVGVIVVTHVSANTPAFLRAVAKIAPIRAVLPKGSISRPRVLDELKENYNVRDDLTKDALKDPKVVKQLIDSSVREDEAFMIADHGKYLAAVMPELQRIYGDRLIGVTEATLNGDITHRAVAEQHTVDVGSIAKSRTKTLGDETFGERIGDAIQSLMLGIDGQDLSQRRIGVIGYGNIGRALGRSLVEKHHIAPQVYDIDQVKKSYAHKDGCHVVADAGVPAIERILGDNDILIFTTGNKALKGKYLNHIKNGAVIAMCTSMDDEIDLSALREQYERKEHTPEYDTYVRKDNPSQELHLLLGGRSVNFYLPGAGKEVALVEGSRLAAMMEQLERHDHPKQHGLPQDRVKGELAGDSEFAVHHLWRKHFPSSQISR